MLKKTITYTDYNGVERTEDFYFNLTKPELLEMEMTATGGFAEMVEKIVAAKDTNAIINIFKEMIKKSYGVKSDDGKRFMKSEELSTAFTQTEAYAQLYMELAFDAEAGAAFVNGVVPADIQKEAAKIQLKDKVVNTFPASNAD